MDRHDSSRNQIEEGLSKMICTQGSLFCGQLRNSVQSPQQVLDDDDMNFKSGQGQRESKPVMASCQQH
jgi:hypothetical protein